METFEIALRHIGLASVYFIFGLAMLFLGRAVWGLITRYKVNKELTEKDNVSAGILEFGFLISLSIIIFGSLKSDYISKNPIYIDLALSFMYTVFGLIALAISKFVLNCVMPVKITGEQTKKKASIDDEISQDKNQALAWMETGFYIGVALIVYGVL